jgi:hypothetical protein
VGTRRHCQWHTRLLFLLEQASFGWLVVDRLLGLGRRAHRRTRHHQHDHQHDQHDHDHHYCCPADAVSNAARHAAPDSCSDARSADACADPGTDPGADSCADAGSADACADAATHSGADARADAASDACADAGAHARSWRCVLDVRDVLAVRGELVDGAARLQVVPTGWRVADARSMHAVERPVRCAVSNDADKRRVPDGGADARADARTDTGPDARAHSGADTAADACAYARADA